MSDAADSALSSENAVGVEVSKADSSATWTGPRLRVVLAADNISQGALATELGVQRPQVVKWLAGTRAIPAVHQQQLPAVLERLRLLQQWPAPPASDVLTAAQLRGARRYLSWTPRELAERARTRGLTVSRQSVGYWEHEQRPIPRHHQDRLRALLTEAVRQLPLGQVLTEDLVTMGVIQKDLADATGIDSSYLTAVRSGRLRMTLDRAASIGQVLDQLAGDSEANLRGRIERLVDLVRAHETTGITQSKLEDELQRGRRSGHTKERRLDERALQIATSELRVHRRRTPVADGVGSQRTSDRWHLGPYPDEKSVVWTAGDLIARREGAGVSRAELARAIGKTRQAIRAWELRESGIPAPHVTAIETALNELARERASRPAPVEVSDERLLETVREQPGRTRRQVFLSFNWHRDNQQGVAALTRLLEDQNVHVWPTRSANGKGWHDGLHPGPAPRRPPRPLPGSQLREQRQARRVRQQDLAAALGIAQPLVSYWERHQLPAARVEEVLSTLQTLQKSPPRLRGDELRRRREEAGLLQRDLADRIGVSQGSIANWERGVVPARRVDEVLQALQT